MIELEKNIDELSDKLIAISLQYITTLGTDEITPLMNVVASGHIVSMLTLMTAIAYNNEESTKKVNDFKEKMIDLLNSLDQIKCFEFKGKKIK